MTHNCNSCGRDYHIDREGIESDTGDFCGNCTNNPDDNWTVQKWPNVTMCWHGNLISTPYTCPYCESNKGNNDDRK